MKNNNLNISILYVEDEPDARKNISEIISRRVSKIYIASNGLEALELYKKHKPDLVLSDIQMPKMNGLELTEKIKQINPKAKIILITAFTDTSYLLKSIALQVDGFIVKPVRKAKLLATIKKQSDIILLEKKNIEQEKAIIDSEERYRLLTETINDVVVQISPTGERLYVSPSIKSFLGYDAGLMDGNSILEFFDNEEDKENAIKILQSIPENHKSGNFEFTYKPYNSARKPFRVEVSYNPLIIDDKVESIQLVMRNISEREEARKALNQHNNELKIRNEELDAFSHTVAHDLKNPLGTMIGFANLLYDDYPNITKEEFEKYINIIIQSGNKTQQIINSLLLFAKVRKEDIKIDEIDIKTIVDEAIKHYQSRITKTKAIIKLPNHWPSVMGNAAWIEEVWVNYISNAIKYGGNPPKIEIGWDKLNTENNTTRFWIRDNGNGIPKKEQNLLFKTFERLGNTKTKGHGLGLSIVKRIINKIGGIVGVESEKGNGSLFFFTLPDNPKPKTIQKPEIAFPKPKTNPKQKNKKLKILIAEDETTADNFLRIIVKNISRETFHAKTGKEAVEIYQNNPDIDLILMDIKMPIMNGYEATKQIRKISKDVVIIAQTAFALSGDREKAIEIGCNDYITKPIDRNQLLEMIRYNITNNNLL